jgi:DNA-directed RNA polymerase specialized sigma24 family protein
MATDAACEITRLLGALKQGDKRSESLLLEALTRLAPFDGRAARTVERIYFGGLTEKEAASVSKVPVRTVKRDSSQAHAWLQAEINRSRP